MRRIVAGVCFLMVTSYFPVQAKTVKSGDRECYGDTVEVQFERYDPRKKEWVAGTKISIPVDIESSLRKPRHLNAPVTNDEKEKWENDCLSEPIVVNSVSFYFSHEPRPTIGLTPDGPLVRRFKLSAGSEGGLFPFMGIPTDVVANFPAVPPGFVEIGDGLTYQDRGNTESAGLYLALPEHKTSSGNRLAFLCSPPVRVQLECQATDSIANGLPGGGVQLQYWFHYPRTPRSEWLKLDQRMRTLVEGLIFQ